jgi:hypothetical protein
LSDQTPSRPATDRNLLFGILALQMDFISRDALIAVMHAWVLDKAKPLAQILHDQGALTADRRTLLEALVQEPQAPSQRPGTKPGGRKLHPVSASRLGADRRSGLSGQPGRRRVTSEPSAPPQACSTCPWPKQAECRFCGAGFCSGCGSTWVQACKRHKGKGCAWAFLKLFQPVVRFFGRACR